LNRSLLRDEEEKAKIQKELSTLTERLSRLNEDIARKMQARVEFDQTVRGITGVFQRVHWLRLPASRVHFKNHHCSRARPRPP